LLVILCHIWYYIYINKHTYIYTYIYIIYPLMLVVPSYCKSGVRNPPMIIPGTKIGWFP
jgi:hypothetical protein